ncbi:MAG: V-type ATP synthase subunit D, partial [Finegoldia magna]|nr:V-type ATP synthase subunit D [Finegoldia magna]
PQMKFSREGEADSSEIYPYGYAQTSQDLDLAIDSLNSVMDDMLELAQIEKATQLMADEIEQTRRRVNALEYRTIPDLEETIKYIRAKLDENERANITRLMKVKDIIAKQENEA